MIPEGKAIFLSKFTVMKKLLTICLLHLLWSCANKNLDLSGETTIKPSDFVQAFKPIKGNYTLSDTDFIKKADTLKIGVKALHQFLPDSTISQMVKNEKKETIYPVGVIEKETEKYFLILVKSKKVAKLFTYVTDQKMNYLGFKELLSNEDKDAYARSVSINKEPTFVISKETYDNNKELKFSRSGWIFNAGAGFMIVVNDSNETPQNNVVINPLDTLPSFAKLSGDYIKNEKNYISIRDGKDAKTYLFFIHFEKNNADCIGELKGTFTLSSPVAGQFTQNGDPCIIDFSFSGNTVRVKEQGTCGNHRGIKCFFDDSFTRKKPSKSKKKHK
jgi:hypothetical protein